MRSTLVKTNNSFEQIDRSTIIRRLKRFIQKYIIALSYQPIGISKYKSKHLLWRIFVSYINLVIITFAVCLLLSAYNVLFFPSYINKPTHYIDLETKFHSNKHQPGHGNPQNKKIFIASNIIQYELIRGSWSKNLLEIVNFLGPKNVFISIYENDSGKATPVILSSLRDQLSQLNCEFSIMTGDHVPLTDFPKVLTPSGELVIKRLKYLSEIRNRMLWPLSNPHDAHAHGQFVSDSQTTRSINFTLTVFDHIIFLNDIYYNPEDAMNLLFSTNKGDYDVTCATDFWHGATIYDTFVLRDTDGFEPDWFTYPWFTTQGSSKSRQDVLNQKDAVRVSSCWNGLAIYKADPFLRPEVLASKQSESNKPPNQVTQPSSEPLRFQYQTELFWETSECCLINAELLQRNPKVKIFLNPYIRVAYTPMTFKWERYLRHIESGLVYLQWWMSRLKVIYEFNPRRTFKTGNMAKWREWRFDNDDLNGEHPYRTVKSLFPLTSNDLKGKWTTISGIAKPGGYCGQKRLFVLLQDFVQENIKNAGKYSGETWRRIIEPPDI